MTWNASIRLARQLVCACPGLLLDLATPGSNPGPPALTGRFVAFSSITNRLWRQAPLSRNAVFTPECRFSGLMKGLRAGLFELRQGAPQGSPKTEAGITIKASRPSARYQDKFASALLIAAMSEPSSRCSRLPPSAIARTTRHSPTIPRSGRQGFHADAGPQKDPQRGDAISN